MTNLKFMVYEVSLTSKEIIGETLFTLQGEFKEVENAKLFLKAKEACTDLKYKAYRIALYDDEKHEFLKINGKSVDLAVSKEQMKNARILEVDGKKYHIIT